MINIVKGTKDVLPAESYRWQYVENKFRETAREFNFTEIRTPVLEHTELFTRGVGDGTDIVNKEMYTFTDKGGRSLTLRPEGTAPAARSVIENNLTAAGVPVKVWYEFPAFRYERPQAGRLREHHQFGVELFGAGGAEADLEVISFAHAFLCKLGIKETVLSVNSVGCPECRVKYTEALKKYHGKHADKLCETCKTRLDKNTLRVLDCKEEGCRALNEKAPLITDYLCSDCKFQFTALQSLLKCVKIEYTHAPRLVRGLDYYRGTVFEFTGGGNAQNALAGGGRYDGLTAALGGAPIPAAGFGLGIERLLLYMDAAGIEIPKPEGADVYFAPIGDEAREKTRGWLAELRRAGCSCESDLLGKSLKAQLKYAAAIGAKYAVIAGEDELKNGEAAVKDMAGGGQESVKFKTLVKYLTEKIKR